MTNPAAVGPERASAARDADDLELLRRYEPILRFTHGELFFPMPAELYVEASTCWPARRREARKSSSRRAS